MTLKVLGNLCDSPCKSPALIKTVTNVILGNSPFYSPFKGFYLTNYNATTQTAALGRRLSNYNDV